MPPEGKDATKTNSSSEIVGVASADTQRADAAGQNAKPADAAAEDAERADVANAEAVRGELGDLFRTHEQRRKQLPRAALVGVIAGLLGSAFRLSLVVVERARTLLVLTLHHRGPWGVGVLVGVGIAGALIAVMLVRRAAPEASGSGIPHLKAVLHHLRGMRWRRIIPVKFLGGVAGIGSGLALGREGPTIQMGGAVGKMVSEILKVNPREQQTLIAAGAGAGLAAAFNAPLAGMVFVLEEVQRDFAPIVFGAALVASVASDVVTRFVTGQDPVFHITDFPIPPLNAMPAFVVVGCLAGILGVVYNRGLLASLDLFTRLRRFRLVLAVAAVGSLAGVTAWLLPAAAGGGYPLLDTMFAGKMSMTAIFGYFGLRFALTMLSYGCGAPGGIFAPLLVLGALLGVLVGAIAHLLIPGLAYYPAAFAVVGMGAYFSAIVRAPLTGIVLMLEMTGKYNQMLPLLLACFAAYAVADARGDRPIYEALMERDLLRGQHIPELQDTLLMDVVVQAGARFVGRQVKDLGLPAGCILVSIHRGLEEIVPTADTTLEAGDRVTAVVSPKAAPAVGMLRKGTCED